MENIKDAQKNIYWFSGALVVVNLVFLTLGALLYIYTNKQGITFNHPDELFPKVALGGSLGITLGVFFILGLIAAAYSSADSALTSLTTSFCVDILDFEKDYPDLKALSFWCRSKNILKLKNNFNSEKNRIGLGMIFHVTPANIPTNFAYSLIFGLLI